MGLTRGAQNTSHVGVVKDGKLLYISGVNAHFLHDSFRDTTRIEKADFIKMLTAEFVKPHLERRAMNMRLKRELTIDNKNFQIS